MMIILFFYVLQQNQAEKLISENIYSIWVLCIILNEPNKNKMY